MDCDCKTLCEADLFILTNPYGILDGVLICWTVPLKHSVRQVCLSVMSLSVFWMVFHCWTVPLKHFGMQVFFYFYKPLSNYVWSFILLDCAFKTLYETMCLY